MTTHKLVFVSIVALAFAGATATSAHADARRSYQSDKSFGIGLMVGAPSGLSAKYYLDAPVALAFGLGSSHYGHHDHDGHNHNHGYHNEGIHLHGDVLWHPVVLTSHASFELPLHVGVGAQVRDHDHYDGHDGHSHLGARVPFGITMDFTNIPLDAFFELAFAIDFVGPDRHSYITGALGARYYF